MKSSANSHPSFKTTSMVSLLYRGSTAFCLTGFLLSLLSFLSCKWVLSTCWFLLLSFCMLILVFPSWLPEHHLYFEALFSTSRFNPIQIWERIFFPMYLGMSSTMHTFLVKCTFCFTESFVWLKLCYIIIELRTLGTFRSLSVTDFSVRLLCPLGPEVLGH